MGMPPAALGLALAGAVLLRTTAAQGGPYNLRITFFDGTYATCSTPPFLVQDFFVPALNQCQPMPSYPPPGTWPNAGKQLKIVSCNSTHVVSAVCDAACGQCAGLTVVPQSICVPSQGPGTGPSFLVNYTCPAAGDAGKPAQAFGRAVDPCWGAQTGVQAACDATVDEVGACDVGSPCNRSVAQLYATCPDGKDIWLMDRRTNGSELKQKFAGMCNPCSLAVSKFRLTRYCSLSTPSACYQDCTDFASAAVQHCTNQVPYQLDRAAWANASGALSAVAAGCAGRARPPPAAGSTQALSVMYYRNGSGGCQPGDALTQQVLVASYTLGVCLPVMPTPANPQPSYRARVDACNGHRLVLSTCDLTCTACEPPKSVPQGQCMPAGGNMTQVVSWSLCPTAPGTAPPPTAPPTPDPRTLPAGGPYNLRLTYFDGADVMCSTPPFLVEDFFFPAVNQVAPFPAYPPPEVWPTAGQSLKLGACNSTAATVFLCNSTGGNCSSSPYVITPGACVHGERAGGGPAWVANYTCPAGGDAGKPPQSAGRAVDPCWAAQAAVRTTCGPAVDGVSLCDPNSPCNRSAAQLVASCPDSLNFTVGDRTVGVLATKRLSAQVCAPCSLSVASFMNAPYCRLDGPCYQDCADFVSGALQACAGQSPYGLDGSTNATWWASMQAPLSAFAAGCRGQTMPPPPPSVIGSVSVTYYRDGGSCQPGDLLGNQTVTYSYSLGQCLTTLPSPADPAAAVAARFDACNAQRVLVRICDPMCTVCQPPKYIARGSCMPAGGGFLQTVAWSSCPVIPPPPTTTTTTTTAAKATMSSPTTTGSSAPPITVVGSMTLATSDPAACAADPAMKSVMASAVATLAGVDQKYVTVTLAVGGRRLAADRRLGGSVIVTYVIEIPRDGGDSASPGGAPAFTPEGVSAKMGSITPDQVQSSVGAALAAQGATPSVSFTVASISPPAVVVPTTTTTLGNATASSAALAWPTIVARAACLLPLVLVHSSD